MANPSIILMKLSRMFPGIRISPTDEELVDYYLRRRIRGLDSKKHVPISEVEIYKFEPWELPGKSIMQSNDEWLFFLPINKSCPNGSKRVTKVGFWKVIGEDHLIKSGNIVIGSKRTLGFYIGQAPGGSRTEWIMQEYSMNEKIDDKSEESYMLCRLIKNNNFSPKNDDQSSESSSHAISSPSSGCSCDDSDEGLNAESTSRGDDLQ